jgi:signal transduction histidine kinase
VEQNINYRDIIISARDLFQIQMSSRNVIFKVIIDPRCKPTIATDPSRLSQVLVNLISNA